VLAAWKLGLSVSDIWFGDGFGGDASEPVVTAIAFSPLNIGAVDPYSMCRHE
jgi:hypothetical protein